MVVAKGSGAPVEESAPQRVYLRRKYLLWSRFPHQRHAGKQPSKQENRLFWRGGGSALMTKLHWLSWENSEEACLVCLRLRFHASTAEKGPHPHPDPGALILNGTLVPSPQEFIN